MIALQFGYRILSNLALVTLTYFSLNALERHQQRLLLAVFILGYASLRAATVLKSVWFLHGIEILEAEMRRLGQLARAPVLLSRSKIISDVASTRSGDEAMAYVELLTLAVTILICIAQIAT